MQQVWDGIARVSGFGKGSEDVSLSSVHFHGVLRGVSFEMRADTHSMDVEGGFTLGTSG